MENDNPKMLEMTVAGGTNVHKLAVSIARSIEEGKTVKLISIGANAINQMVKGAAKSSGRLAPVGKFLLWRIYFMDRQISAEQSRTGKVEDLSAMAMESHLL